MNTTTLRLATSSVRGHLVRFLLTAGAVMLGVSFVTGTFVLRDSIDSTLNSLFSQALKGIDVQVRPQPVEGNDFGQQRAGLPLDLESTLSEVDGVARVSADVSGTALVAGADGLVVRNGGAPGLGFAYRDDDPSFTLVAGRAPTGPSEVVLESTTLDSSGLAIGDRTRVVIGSEVREAQVVGEAEFGSMFGATAVLVDETTARQAFAPDGLVAGFSVSADPGTDQAQLAERVQSVLPTGAEAITADQLNDETQDGVQQGLGFFTTFLLVFAAVALFVGSFIIVNTFSMLIAQRTRELALLRAVGASRGQVMRMVLGEALLVGLIGSLLGIGLGLLVVIGAKWGIRSFLGADIGDDLPLSGSTVLISLLVGTVVTLIAAAIPARRAARIAPVAAMRDDQVMAPQGVRLRGSIGSAIAILGIVGMAVLVTRDEVIWSAVGAAAAAAVLGVVIAAPLLTRPIVRLVAWPFATWGGVVGRLARENALRVPRRTASTASALMIGLALISGLSVLGQSVRASVSDIIAQEASADFVLNAGNGALVPASVSTQIADQPGVGQVAPVSALMIALKDGAAQSDVVFATAIEAAAFGPLVNVDIPAETAQTVDDGKVLISQTFADEQGLAPGSQLSAIVGGDASPQQLTVGGVYPDHELLGEMTVGRALYLDTVPVSQQGDQVVLVDVAAGADAAAVRQSLTETVKPYLVVSVDDGQEYADSAASGVDILLNLLSVLLLFSVVVAVLGIVNTLALSVIERTREIGLLRAVGLQRRQLAGMITTESVATAVFGAVLGTGLGLGLGIAMQRGLSSQGLEVLAIPWTTIIGVLIAAALVGVIAAVLPAIRAVRLDVLKAIATE